MGRPLLLAAYSAREARKGLRNTLGRNIGGGFLFHVTLGRAGFGDRMARISMPERLPVVLSPEEVALLLAHASNLKHRATLSVAYGCGLRISEIARLKVSDIDSARMPIRLEQGKGRKDRYVMLSPDPLTLLRQWWRAKRPKGLLFPGQQISTRQLDRACGTTAASADIPSGRPSDRSEPVMERPMFSLTALLVPIRSSPWLPPRLCLPYILPRRRFSWPTGTT
jgi:integrase/recombinase XerD